MVHGFGVSRVDVRRCAMGKNPNVLSQIFRWEAFFIEWSPTLKMFMMVLGFLLNTTILQKNQSPMPRTQGKAQSYSPIL